MAEKVKKQKTVEQLNKKKIGWQIGDFFGSFGPVAVPIAVNWRTYFTAASGVKFGAGVVIVSVFALLIALKRVKISRNVWMFGVVFALTFLLRSLLTDLMLISGLAFFGEILHEGIFQRRINAVEHEIERAERREDMEAVRDA